MITKNGKELSLEEFEKLTGAKWIPGLDFADFHLFSDITQRALKLHKKGKMTPEQLWLGSYFKKEILSAASPDVEIRWIDSTLGWGVFALRNFKKMEFIAEYSGKLVKRKSQSKNAYAFEYIIVQGIATPYTIDASEQGGIARYINHSATPNLNSSLATLENVSRVILYTKEPVAKGIQLCYDYGPDYWAKRAAPVSLF
jgi:hypothetical protein